MNKLPIIAGSLLFSSLLAFSATKENLPTPTHGDISYGKDPKQKIDIWLAKSDAPTPLVVYIHGGGWTGGDKDAISKDYLTPLLDRGISVASINYRLSKTNPLPVPVHDAARALQFVRSKASEWNLDKERVALMGNSAGGCTSLWIAFHDDLANEKSEDPVERESTRVCAVFSRNGQTSIDPKWITEHIGVKGAEHSMICSAVGEASLTAVLKNYETHEVLYTEFSPLTHLTPDDPPYYGLYAGHNEVPAISLGAGIHHRVFGIKLKEKSDAIGHSGCLSTKRNRTSLSEIDFITKILLGKNSDEK
ncbi:alpha/beta hydrolase [Pontiella sulfatireligans]|uniref:Carboxylesterase NlhH n=1 Tax=Pontiella sulfatireligans TaxID=2750658 RepID=A0A6C2UNX4_9BACT|nr:alpha/beta hydrolase [Pontiella sulfatireligans]VGO21888.1 Carboxylesterase NlhH [Pontiella sulfatireligans]